MDLALAREEVYTPLHHHHHHHHHKDVGMNQCRAKFNLGNIKINLYFHFLTQMAQVAKICLLATSTTLSREAAMVLAQLSRNIPRHNKRDGVSIVCSAVCSGADRRKYQSSASLAFVRGIHRWPVNSPHSGPVTRKMFSVDDVIIIVSALEEPILVIWHGHDCNCYDTENPWRLIQRNRS